MLSMIYLVLGVAVLLGLVLLVRIGRIKHQARPRRGWPGGWGGNGSDVGGEWPSHHSHASGHGHDSGGGDVGGGGDGGGH